MRFTLCVAMLAVCIIALQSTADSASEDNDDPSPPQQPNSGGQTGSGTVAGQQVSGVTGTSQSGVGQQTPPKPPLTPPPPGTPATPEAAASGEGAREKDSEGGEGVDGGKGGAVQHSPPGGSGNPDVSLPDSSGSSISGVSGGAADKTVTTTTTSTAANASPANPLSEADQSQQKQGPEQQGQAQGTENNSIQGSGPTHNNPGGVPPNELKTVTTATTKPVTELGDKGSAKGDRDRVAEEEQTHQAEPPSTISTPNAASKQITSTPSRDTVDGVPQHNGEQPSPTPDKRTRVVRDPNTASSSGEEVHADEVTPKPHTERRVSEDLTKTQPAQEQTPPTSVNPQTPPSTTTVKENVTLLVPATSTTTGTSKDIPLNNNPPTTSTAGD